MNRSIILKGKFLNFYLMKKFLVFLVAIILGVFFWSCKQTRTNQLQTNSKAEVEVLYFHTTIRCPACIAIENNTKKVLDENFKTLLDSGIIQFRSYNMDEKANKSLVEKYQISYLTLLIIKTDGTKTDFTDNAFKYTDTKPEKFMELLKAEIDKNLE
jgi:hypothetical protein